DAVLEAGRVPVDELARVLADINVESAVKSLLRRGLVRRSSELAPPRTSGRIERALMLTNAGRATIVDPNELSNAPRRRQVLGLIADKEPIFASELSRLVPRVQPILKHLERAGLIRVESREVRRSAFDADKYQVTQPLRLSPAQQMAQGAISRALHGSRSE